MLLRWTLVAPKEAIVFFLFLLMEPSRNRRHHLMPAAIASSWGEVISQSAAVHPATFYTPAQWFLRLVWDLPASSRCFGMSPHWQFSALLDQESIWWCCVPYLPVYMHCLSRWILAGSLQSTFAAASWFAGDGIAGFCFSLSCCSKAFIRSSFHLSSSLRNEDFEYVYNIARQWVPFFDRPPMEWVAYHSPVCADGKYYPEGFFIYKREVLQRGYPSQPDFNKK